MAAIEIKGVRIGVERPKTIVPLLDATLEELVEAARRAVAAGADCVEWRADFLDDPHDVAALQAAARALAEALPATPLIATLRTTGQGGRLGADPEEYARLVNALTATATPGEATGPDVVDIELGSGDDTVRELVATARQHGVRTIVSHHDFERTPGTDWMADKLCHMFDLGASIPKIAVMAQSPTDAARLMEATACAAQRVDAPLLTMAMGDAGTITRLAGESFGSALTFCSLDAASAPGQVSLAEATAALDALHAALHG